MAVKTVNILSELLQKEPNDPFIFVSFVFSFSSVTDNRHHGPYNHHDMFFKSKNRCMKLHEIKQIHASASSATFWFLQ